MSCDKHETCKNFETDCTKYEPKTEQREVWLCPVVVDANDCQKAKSITVVERNDTSEVYKCYHSDPSQCHAVKATVEMPR